MTTPKQIAANRRKSQKSSRPNSAETTAKIAQNGVMSSTASPPNSALLKNLKTGKLGRALGPYHGDEQSAGEAEIEPVVKITEHTWVADRALRPQNLCFSPDPKTPRRPKTVISPSASR